MEAKGHSKRSNEVTERTWTIGKEVNRNRWPAEEYREKGNEMKGYKERVMILRDK